MRQTFKIPPKVMRQKKREIYDMRERIRLDEDTSERINTLPVPDELPDWADGAVKGLCRVNFDFHRHVLLLEVYRRYLMEFAESSPDRCVCPMMDPECDPRMMLYKSIMATHKTISDCAKLRGVSESTVRRWINSGKVSAQRVYGQWLINVARLVDGQNDQSEQTADDLSSRLSIRLLEILDELRKENRELKNNLYHFSKNYNFNIALPDAVYGHCHDAIRQFERYIAELIILTDRWFTRRFYENEGPIPHHLPSYTACLDLSLDPRQLARRINEYFAELERTLAPEWPLAD